MVYQSHMLPPVNTQLIWSRYFQHGMSTRGTSSFGCGWWCLRRRERPWNCSTCSGHETYHLPILCIRMKLKTETENWPCLLYSAGRCLSWCSPPCSLTSCWWLSTRSGSTHGDDSLKRFLLLSSSSDLYLKFTKEAQADIPMSDGLAQEPETFSKEEVIW